LGVPIISTIPDTIIISNWLTIGPFSSGVREPGISYLPDSENFIPYEGLKHRDILTQGGELTWHRTKSETGKVKVKGDSVNWDFIQDLYGGAGVNGVSYAYAEFENQGEKRALVIAEGAGFRLNGKGFVGDPYAAGYVRIPVLLKDGKNRILVSVGGSGDQDFTFKIIPAPFPVMAIYKDATVPDIIYGEELNSWVGIPILNTTPNTINNVTVTIGYDSPVGGTSPRNGGDLPQSRLESIGVWKPLIQKITLDRIAPLCGKKIPVPLKITQAIKESIPGDTILVPIKIIYENYIDSGYIKLRLRKSSQTRKETFISAIDSSVQYYAVLPPVNFAQQEDYSLILTLHGAGVEANGQVDSYSPKDWAFIIAPTNRRPFGFDWQDWGRLDALEVLEIVKKKYPIDENRIYLAGHSMGGHGTWHIGLTHSDLFAAIVPSAGWTSHQIYVPWSLQKSLFFGHPDQLAIRDKVLREDNPLVFLENARNLPIYILQGGADDNVPPIHARLFAKYLETDAKFRNADFIYKEAPGMGHWWDNDTLPGAACVDNPELMQFVKNHARNPYPKHIHFKTTDLGMTNTHYWLKVDELEKLYQDGIIDASIEDSAIIIQTNNIRAFTLNLNENLIRPGKIRLLINNQEIKHAIHSMPYALSLMQEASGLWRITSGFESGSRSIRVKERNLKVAATYGPIKQAYFSPFVLVYGTKGDSTMTELLLHQARIQALTWWIRANGQVEVLPDSEVTQSIVDKYNLILFGNAQTNAVTARINNKLPIRILDGQAQLNISGVERKASSVKRLYGNFGIIFVYPNPLNPKKLILVYEGTTEKGQKLSDRFGTLYSGAGLPDFLILGEKVKQKGWGGVKAAGFFSNQWKLESDLMYLGDE
jgi:predicted esterase